MDAYLAVGLVIISTWLAGCICYFFRSGNRTCRLVHLTEKSLERKIVSDRKFAAKSGGPIFALLGSFHNLCSEYWQLCCLTMLPLDRVKGAVEVPPDARLSFKLMIPCGSYTALKCLCGNYLARYRLVAFDGLDRIKAERGKNFSLIYLIDACMIAFWVFAVIYYVRYH